MRFALYRHLREREVQAVQVGRLLVVAKETAAAASKREREKDEREKIMRAMYTEQGRKIRKSRRKNQLESLH